MRASIDTAKQRRPARAAFAIGLGLGALGALLVWQGFALPDKSGYAGIGSGAAPKAVGAGLILLGLAHVYQGIRSNSRQGLDLSHSPQNWSAIGWLVAGLLLQLFTLKALGFTIASALLFAFTARAMGFRNWLVALPAGLVLAFVVYGIFDGLLKLNLPAGMVEHLDYGG